MKSIPKNISKKEYRKILVKKIKDIKLKGGDKAIEKERYIRKIIRGLDAIKTAGWREKIRKIP